MSDDLTPYELVVVPDGPGRLGLRVTGEVDLAVAPQLLDSVLCAGLAGGDQDVVVDLSGVTFIDSSGLGALLEAHRRLSAEGCRLSVTGMSPRIRRLVESSGLAGSFGFDRYTERGRPE